MANPPGNTVDTILNNGQTDVVSIGLINSRWAGSSATPGVRGVRHHRHRPHELRHPWWKDCSRLDVDLFAQPRGTVFGPLLTIGPDVGTRTVHDPMSIPCG